MVADVAPGAAHDPNLPAEHVDVLIVGAGISGIGAAWHLQQQCPDRSYAILEMFESYGGTWLSHKYPGIRSDSDLYTFGYRFKPWIGPPIATADEILKYMGEVIDENDIGRHIRYRHKILRADWSSTDNRWTLEAVDLDSNTIRRFTCEFLWMCQGYYRHNQGFTPSWPGMDKFQGRIVHPEEWPEDVEVAGKRVVLIGSGATAATVVPAIAGKAAHVTVLQRSPTYFFPSPNANELADMLRVLEIDETWIHEIVRRKVLFEQQMLTRRCQDDPDTVRRELMDGVRAYLGPDYPVDVHFNPRYRPWQQRLAFVPGGDMFKGIAAGLASMVTDEPDHFDATGIVTKSGEHLDADLVITATGFNLCMLGDIAFHIDGKPLNFPDTVTFRGMMFTGIPNMCWIFGYFRASWTLRVDLIADFVCRLLNHMRDKQSHRVEVALRPEDADMELLPWMEPEDFNPGYLQRGAHLLPKRGTKPEWKHTQDYWADKAEMPAIDLDDPLFRYA